MARTKQRPARLPPVATAQVRSKTSSAPKQLNRSRSEFEIVTISSEQLPGTFIGYLQSSGAQPARKRQKISHEPVSTGPDVAEYNTQAKICVADVKLDIKCVGPTVEGQLDRTDLRPYLAHDNGLAFLRLDDSDSRVTFQVSLEGRKDFVDALEVSTSISAKSTGALESGFGLSLFEINGTTCLSFRLTINWAVTNSPYDLARVNKKSAAVNKVLATYFPDPTPTESQAWSPQDFYTSVHVPGQDEGTSPMGDPAVTSNLFPFQRRAVQWLLRKEGVRSGDGPELPLSFTKVKDAKGRQCYISHLFGTVTLDPAPFVKAEESLRGGILAEEMGLGKTLETISLITLHQRPQELETVKDYYTGDTVRPTAATLIVSPPSIAKQWVSEIQKHAPQLKVMQYEGFRSHKKTNNEELVEELATSDVVVSTYPVLAAEINYTSLNPEKSLRQESKYPRPKSPLMQLSWWRVCIDEAQMIESGVSKAAIVARMIPRVNAWCITGTPVKKDVNDLHGLLIFLRYEPFASIKHVWSSLISTHKHEFRQLFNRLALRHSKRLVREELKLPAQRRYVITMPFTPIEEQHYQELFAEMCGDVGVGLDGSPLTDDWDPVEASESMRHWLVRLRQTALHPELGGRNRRALGLGDKPLRTVDEVLQVMMDSTDTAIRVDQRAMLLSRLKRGQLLENSPRVKQALEIWEAVVKDSTLIVDDCREQLNAELAQPEKADPAEQSMSDDGDALDQENEASSRLGVLRNRLRGALEVLHIAVFFRANAHFQIKSNTEMTAPDSPEFEALEKLETEGYEEAKRLRREILQEIFQKSENLISKIAKRAEAQSFVTISEFSTRIPKGGIESRRILEQMDELAEALDAQSNKLDEWREKTIGFLLKPLVDEDEEVEITGDEYEQSTKTQEEVMVYVQALRFLVAERHHTITGQENKLQEHEIKTTLHFAKQGEGVFPEKTLQLVAEHEALKTTPDMGSVRGVVGELRALVTSLRQDGSARAENELSIVEEQFGATQKQLIEHTKITVALEKEIELFTTVMNARLEFYRQLQQVSDMVAPYEGPNDDAVARKMRDEEARLAQKVAAARSKRKYLEHLQSEASNPQEQRICVICRESFEIGALTVCGHQYCKECLGIWFKAHHNCPVCKKKLSRADLHEISYKPQILSIEAEEVAETTQERATSTRKSAIYSEISQSKLAEIKNIELDGPSFTTKVDTLARHLIWLRETDPGAKSIIYSQFKDFLGVLARAFERFRIGFSSIDKPNGIEKFKQDASVECFLLHSRAHSSGLNLVNASHVFLCEPLLNTALELQAIARVDRIGQRQETNVWLYLVDGTVEESIHQLSVNRRMEHVGQTLTQSKAKATADELLDTNLEEANSMQLQQASMTRLLAKGGKGGENIPNEDLWDCLFGVAKRNLGRLDESELRSKPEVRRLLAAEAAEGRANAEGS